MGHGIAHVACLGGYETVLQDISEEMLGRAEETVRKNLNKAAERNLITEDQASASVSRLTAMSDLEPAVRDADFVIEAIPEIIEVKIELYTCIDKVCKPDAFFASNTSSLSVTEMAAVTERPQRFIGMHFFNPVHKMKLVEIVRGLETSEETVAVTKEVGERMGKETVTIKESPGFITSRINAMIGNEAFYMLQEGIASAEEIDKALKLGLNHPMGPFEMVDLVGLDTRLHILKFLHQSLGEKYRPCPLMEQYVKAGRLGRKVGKGVYDYSDRKG
ncbi:3-hydroxyacyl-CoA dehydrogenase NAD-binding domain-containing protein [bacterium]|nr:3-hydroxyacyl-CoA dehydrogenase NAD-binding domain-containing protein [bacterium]